MRLLSPPVLDVQSLPPVVPMELRMPYIRLWHGEAPVMQNWPSYVWHLANAQQAVNLLTNGSRDELVLDFGTDLALSRNEYQSQGVLLAVRTSVLSKSKIEPDERTGGEYFAYYGTILGKNFTAFRIT